MSMRLLSRTLRPALALRHIPVAHAARRHISGTRPAQAAEDTKSFVANFQYSPLWRQLADKPEALRALQELTEMIKAKGWNLDMDNPPSMVTIMRIASDPDFRAASKRVIDELHKAGIELKPENAFEMLTGRRPDDGEKKG